jgi:Tol biopolymer transport system component
MMLSSLNRWTILCLLLAITACGDDPASPGTGTVEVTTVSTGKPGDQDGYIVHLKGVDPAAIGVNATVTLPEVAAGDLEIRLASVRGNCTVQGPHPRLIRVVAGEIFRVHFDVACVNTAQAGRIVFTNTAHGNRELYSIRPDGTGRARITETPDEQERDASVSPDGRRIVFTNWPYPPFIDFGTTQVVLMNGDGSGRIDLSRNPDSGYDTGPIWSPDGARIAVSGTRGLNFGIWAMNADGTGVQLLTDTSAYSAGVSDWSRDGARILYSASYTGGDHSQIWVMNADGTGKTRLTDVPANPTDIPAGAVQAVWSPDGQRIAFVSDQTGTGKIYLMNADGSDPVQLTDAPGWESNPSWSPDGTRLLFNGTVDGTQSDLYLVNPDGTGLVNITNTPDDTEFNGPQAWGP